MIKSDIRYKFNKGGAVMEDQMEIAFMQEGGMVDEGGQVEEESGNEVPIGALKEEVADDVPAMVSEGEFVFPADVVRYIGLEKLMRLRQEAKMGLKRMEAMGQMGNSDEATMPDDLPFGEADIVIMGSAEPPPQEMYQGGIIQAANGGMMNYQPSSGILGYQPSVYQGQQSTGQYVAPTSSVASTPQNITSGYMPLFLNEAAAADKSLNVNTAATTTTAANTTGTNTTAANTTGTNIESKSFIPTVTDSYTTALYKDPKTGEEETIQVLRTFNADGSYTEQPVDSKYVGWNPVDITKKDTTTDETTDETTDVQTKSILTEDPNRDSKDAKIQDQVRRNIRSKYERGLYDGEKTESGSIEGFFNDLTQLGKAFKDDVIKPVSKLSTISLAKRALGLSNKTEDPSIKAIFKNIADKLKSGKETYDEAGRKMEEKEIAKYTPADLDAMLKLSKLYKKSNYNSNQDGDEDSLNELRKLKQTVRKKSRQGLFGKKDVRENMEPLERAEYEVMTMQSRMRGEETRLKQKKRRKDKRRSIFRGSSSRINKLINEGSVIYKSPDTGDYYITHRAGSYGAPKGEGFTKTQKLNKDAIKRAIKLEAISDRPDEFIPKSEYFEKAQGGLMEKV